MLLNSLISNTGGLLDSIDLTKQLKITKPTYLFSDIIRLVGANQPELSGTSYFPITSGTAQLNFSDVLGQLTAVTKFDNKTIAAPQIPVSGNQNSLPVQIKNPDNSSPAVDVNNSRFPAAAQTQNIISTTGLQNFLSDLFNRLSAIGFQLKGVKGLQPAAGNVNDQNAASGQNPVSTNEHSDSLIKDSSVPVNVNLQNGDGKLNNEVSADPKISSKEAKPGQPENVDINQAIFNILQANRPVILNFNFAGQTLKIEISNAENEPGISVQNNADSTGSQPDVNALTNQASKVISEFKTAAVNSDSGNKDLAKSDSIEKIDYTNQVNIKGDPLPGTEINNLQAAKGAVPDAVNAQSNSTNSTSAGSQIDELIKNLAVTDIKINSAEKNLTSSSNLGEPTPADTIVNPQSGEAKKSIDQIVEQFTTVDNAVTGNALNNFQPQAQSGNKFNVTISSGNKAYSLSGSQGLEQFLAGLNIQDNIDVNGSSFPKYITELLPETLDPAVKAGISMKQQLLNNANAAQVQKQQAAAAPDLTKASESISSPKPKLAEDVIMNTFDSNAKALQETNVNNSNPAINQLQNDLNMETDNAANTPLQTVITEKEFFSNGTFNGETTPGEIKKNNLTQNDLPKENLTAKHQLPSYEKNLTIDSNTFTESKINLPAASIHHSDSTKKILDGTSGAKKNSDNELSASFSELNKKEVITENKVINTIQSKDSSIVQDNSVNKLAGAAQNSVQASGGSNNQQVDNGSGTSQVAASTNVSPDGSTKADTSGDGAGKRSDTGKRQYDDTKISTGQSLSAEKQSIIKNETAGKNVTQFNDVYKTIKASDLVSEIAHIISEGESKSVVLKLQPGDLGKVKIALEVVDKAVHANIEVENESVKQAVQNNINNLKQSLNLNGLQLSNVSVSLSGGESKSNKAFAQKKKANQNLYNKKIDSAGDITASKSLGYNTYEYLI